MMAAAVAAMAAGAFADDCEREVEHYARIYQMQMNVYTTKGVTVTELAAAGSLCEREEGEATCLVLRGKDKTVFRGYVYICDNLCDLSNYEVAFADVRRKGFFGTIDDGEWTSGAELTWDFINFIGKNATDVEAAWNFEGTVNNRLTEELAQTYTLRGAGYGVVRAGADKFVDNLGGYFAGTASASFDLSVKNNACLCQPSMVYDCENLLEPVDGCETVAFGSWKMKFNANVSTAYNAGLWSPAAAVKKLFK